MHSEKKSSLSPQRSYFKNNRYPNTAEALYHRRSRSQTPEEDSRFDMLYQNAFCRKQKLEKMAKTDRQRFDKNYTFSPVIPRRVAERHYDGNVAQRNELWMEQRKKRLIDIEQQEIVRRMKPCTFSPHIKSKRNAFYLKEKAKKALEKEKNPEKEQKKKPKQLPIDYENAKRNIMARIQTMHI